jgi:hypothetical protein
MGEFNAGLFAIALGLAVFNVAVFVALKMSEAIAQASPIVLLCPCS